MFSYLAIIVTSHWKQTDQSLSSLRYYEKATLMFSTCFFFEFVNLILYPKPFSFRILSVSFREIFKKLI